MVKFSATQDNWKGKTSVDASLIIVQEVISGAFGSPKIYLQVQLLLSDYNFGTSIQNPDTEKGQEHELDNLGNIGAEQESDETGANIIDVEIETTQEPNVETGGTIIDVIWSNINEFFGYEEDERGDKSYQKISDRK